MILDVIGAEWDNAYPKPGGRMIALYPQGPVAVGLAIVKISTLKTDGEFHWLCSGRSNNPVRTFVEQPRTHVVAHDRTSSGLGDHRLIDRIVQPHKWRC